MRLLEDGIIAALAAVGLVTLLFLLISALVRPRARDLLDAYAVVPCGSEDGKKLEYTVRALERARYEYGGFRRIVILDCGMDGESRKIAALLGRDSFDVNLRSRGQLEREMGVNGNGRTDDGNRHDRGGHLSE